MPERDIYLAFEEKFFSNEINRFVGSGGEMLIKGVRNREAPQTRIDVGDRLIGIGMTHIVESLSRVPGPESFRVTTEDAAKAAMRAFVVTGKNEDPEGFVFALSPLSPQDYSALVDHVAGSSVKISHETIPVGTMIISFLNMKTTYSLKTMDGSPAKNFAEACRGVRHWNVGIGGTDDFWVAHFPSDDIGMLANLSSGVRVGSIRFGLSILAGSKGVPNLKPVEFVGPSGKTTRHHFSLSGTGAGTQGLDTPFPIGLRTEIMFHPLSAHEEKNRTTC